MKHRIAFIIRGAISKTQSAFDIKDDLTTQQYIDYVACYNSTKKYIIDANPDFIFDFFIFSWNTNLEKELVSLYNPISYKFENNDKHKNLINSVKKQYENRTKECLFGSRIYAQLSQSIAMKKGIEIVQEYCDMSNVKYDKIILYRPDVLLWKPMYMNKYDTTLDCIYVNGHEKKGGDFHFVMSMEIANEFKDLFDSAKDCYNTPVYHVWIRKYVEEMMGKMLVMDDIRPGISQELMRKVKN